MVDVKLRDWFAGQAMRRLKPKVASNHADGTMLTELARLSYKIADAMMEARKKPVKTRKEAK